MPWEHTAASTIHSHWRIHRAHTQALTSLSRLENQFASLRRAFIFPAQLDFAPDSPAPKPLYTANNTPLHAYEHQLTSLLTKIDEINSGGAQNVRDAGKALVMRVEAELEDLDRWKIGVWEARNGATAGGVSVESRSSLRGRSDRRTRRCTFSDRGPNRSRSPAIIKRIV